MGIDTIVLWRQAKNDSNAPLDLPMSPQVGLQSAYVGRTKVSAG